MGSWGPQCGQGAVAPPGHRSDSSRGSWGAPCPPVASVQKRLLDKTSSLMAGATRISFVLVAVPSPRQRLALSRSDRALKGRCAEGVAVTPRTHLSLRHLLPFPAPAAFHTAARPRPGPRRRGLSAAGCPFSGLTAQRPWPRPALRRSPWLLLPLPTLPACDDTPFSSCTRKPLLLVQVQGAGPRRRPRRRPRRSVFRNQETPERPSFCALFPQGHP